MKVQKKNPIIRLFAESRESWIGWMTLLLLSFLSGWFATEIARLIGRLVDLGISAQYAQMKGVGVALGVVLLLNCVRTSLHYHVNAQTTETMFRNVRKRMFTALTCGRIAHIEGRFQTGEVVSRLNSDVGNLCEAIAGSFTWYLRVILEALVTLCACIAISRELSLIYLILMPASFYIMNALSKTLRARQKKISRHTGNAASIVSETLSNIATVKAFGIEDQMREKFAGEVEVSKQQEIGIQRTEAMIVGVRYFMQILQLSGLFGAAIWLVTRGALSPGDAIAFITICANIRTALELSDRMITSYHKSVALAERVYEVLDIPLMQQGGGQAALSEEAVCFDDVTFSYGETRPVLNHVSLRVPRGQRIGVVGPSGCGKSTLIKLICKFYQVNSGTLSIFGKNVDELSEKALYERVALVGQEPYLFSGSIYENIVNGKADATEAEVEDVLRRVQLWDHVSSLKLGMHTPVGEAGKELSGGQGQRISIARALIKDADLILLDEPTAALDVKTEYELKAAFEELLKGKTAMIVTHRYAIIENADAVYCIDEKGGIGEYGTPAELLEKKGYYSSMYRAQMNG